MFKELCVIIVAAALLFGVILAAAYAAETEKCTQQSVSFSNHKFGFFSGCMVEHNGRWLPLDSIRSFADED